MNGKVCNYMGEIIRNNDELSNLMCGFDRTNIKIIMANGCFDLFHVGHLNLLKFAKCQGNILIVAVNSDYSVNKLKGSSRPIVAQSDRIELLSSLIYVDYVILFDEDTPSKLINIIKPDIIVKEEEYKTKKLPEIDTIKQCGAELAFYKRKNNISTSTIIDRIKGL